MKVKIKGITGHILNMEAVLSGGISATSGQREMEILGYAVKILADDGTRIEFGMLTVSEIEVLS